MKCERCQSESQSQSMSWFNTQMICPRCQKIESRHPKFEEAKQRESAQVKAGNMNYRGIGLPQNLNN